MQKSLFIAILAIVVMVTALFAISWHRNDIPDAAGSTVYPKPLAETYVSAESLHEQPPVENEAGDRYVLDIVLHTAAEIEQMLDKAEQLSSKPRSATEPASIAIVLHGPEIDIFSINNYKKYHDIVDRAARLDAYNIIDVKMCLTTMRIRGVRKEDIPGFIDFVPFGPAEVERLQQRGYVKF